MNVKSPSLFSVADPVRLSVTGGRTIPPRQGQTDRRFFGEKPLLRKELFFPFLFFSSLSHARVLCFQYENPKG